MRDADWQNPTHWALAVLLSGDALDWRSPNRERVIDDH